MTRSVYAHMSYVDRDDGNLGDKMGFHIADWMIGAGSYERIGMREPERIDRNTVAIVGSVIAALVATECRIVGGGLINANTRNYHPGLRIDGVRGFLTKSIIQRDSKNQHKPRVIGDPGLLLSRMEPLPYCRDTKPLGFIVHDVDRTAFAQKYPEHVDDIVDNYAPRAEFVRQLSRYRAVASTSLHGCVFCHSYNIPVAPFVLTDKVYGGDFKFEDYYSSYGLNITRRPLDGHPSQLEEKVRACPQPDVGRLQHLQDAQRSLIEDALVGK